MYWEGIIWKSVSQKIWSFFFHNCIQICWKYIFPLFPKRQELKLGKNRLYKCYLKLMAKNLGFMDFCKFVIFYYTTILQWLLGNKIWSKHQVLPIKRLRFRGTRQKCFHLCFSYLLAKFNYRQCFAERKLNSSSPKWRLFDG